MIDVATIEGAVITGSQAAEAIRTQFAPTTRPITIVEPEAFPWEMFRAIKLAFAPAVAGAKLWSAANPLLGRFGMGWDTMQRSMIDAASRALEPYVGRMPNPPEYLGPLNWQNSARNLPPDDPRAIGPLYWLYNADGTRKSAAAKDPVGAK
jgi:hypothetical protein